MVLLLLFPVLFGAGFLVPKVAAQASLPLYFGVDVAIGDIEQTKQLIDNISTYTNFFVIGCSYDYNTSRLTDISDYVYQKGLNFLVFTDDPRYPTSQWLQYANQTYGEQFMGIYFYDEAGGKQLDQAKYPAVLSAANNSDAAEQYVQMMSWWLGNNTDHRFQGLLNNADYHFYTSDYAFYWWDYQSGYDTVFLEFGERGGSWTYSRQLNVALCRGAATAFDRDWGVMITWSYVEPPYMESGSKLYNDMVLAYQNGAKYIVVFDSNENWTQNVLMEEHLNAMKQFWTYAKDNPRSESFIDVRTAAVLPENYAYGFRGPSDRVWGLFEPDNFTIQLSTSVLGLLETYGGSLDLIYPTSNQNNLGYLEVIPWDSTIDPTAEPAVQASGDLVNVVLGGVAVLFVAAVTAVITTRRKPPKPHV